LVAELSRGGNLQTSSANSNIGKGREGNGANFRLAVPNCLADKTTYKNNIINTKKWMI